MEYFGKAGLNGQTAKLTTVKQVREIGSAVLTCEDLSNWATDTPVFFATYKVDIDTQKIVPNSQINWRGKVNVENNTIIEIQADSDTPDKGNAIGDIVECLPTAGWANSLVDGISVIHKQDGTLKNNVVKGQNIDFVSIEDGSIEPGKLSTDMGVYSARTASLSAPLQGAIQDLANNGAKITLNLKKNARILVTVFVGMKSTSDFEFKPAILVNGIEKYREEVPASLATNGRAVQRSAQVAFDIPAGTRIISAGVWSQSATNQEVSAGAASISVIVFK